MAEAADDFGNGDLTPSGKILYAAVANWSTHTVLTDYTSKYDRAGTCEGVFAETVLTQLEAPNDTPASCTKYSNNKIYYTSHDNGFAIAHMCTGDYSVTHSLMFQNELVELFADAGFPADQPADGFRGTLKEKVNLYTTNPPRTKFDQAQGKIDEVKMVLIDNIEAVVKRHGQIEITLDETESLKETSRQFSSSSQRVKQQAQCQLYRTYAIAALVILLILGVLIGMICLTAKCGE